jgi:hypothetical protein
VRGEYHHETEVHIIGVAAMKASVQRHQLNQSAGLRLAKELPGLSSGLVLSRDCRLALFIDALSRLHATI